MRAQLIPLEGGPSHLLVKDLTLVGRKPNCDLRLEHRSVSKHHCVIVKTDGLLLLRDLGSTNGTRVNGQRIRRAALLPNDQLHIAGCQFRVHLGPDDAPEEMVSVATQNLDADEIRDLMRRLNPQQQEEPEKNHTAPSVRANALPDLYPEDRAPK
jgi:pSer/pThr/pTyr-binding forkhead associated (FHA) protein